MWSIDSVPMPFRSDWRRSREGLTGDTLGHLLNHTILNPALTIPLTLLACCNVQGSVFANQHTLIFKHLKTLVALGLIRTANSWLNSAVLNNWSSDTYIWSREVVVVTGGSDGIGKLVVLLLAEMDIKIAVLDVQELTYEAPPSVRFVKCDLSSPTAIAAAAVEVRSSLGRPTVLINNAGVARGKSILEATEKDIDLTFKVNTFSHYYLTQQFLPSMIMRNHGMIVTVASLTGFVTVPSMVDYSASKAASIAFHEGLSAELATHYKAPKVRTVLMCPGFTRTALLEGFGGTAMYPDTVAKGIVKAILGGKSKHLILPKSWWHIAPTMKGWPLWMQYSLRKGLADLVKGWRGRQVAQPSEVEGEKGVTDPIRV